MGRRITQWRWNLDLCIGRIASGIKYSLVLWNGTLVLWFRWPRHGRSGLLTNYASEVDCLVNARVHTHARLRSVGLSALRELAKLAILNSRMLWRIRNMRLRLYYLLCLRSDVRWICRSSRSRAWLPRHFYLRSAVVKAPLPISMIIVPVLLRWWIVCL